MTKCRITRESLLAGSHHARVSTGQRPHVQFMTDGECRSHVAAILAHAPRPDAVARIRRQLHGRCLPNSARAAKTEFDVPWRREMSSRSYRPVRVGAYTRRGPVPALAFAVNRSHERYVRGLDTETVARYIATGAGQNGSCREYLFDTAEHLRRLGVRDRRMEVLTRRVRDLRPDEEPALP